MLCTTDYGINVLVRICILSTKAQKNYQELLTTVNTCCTHPIANPDIDSVGGFPCVGHQQECRYSENHTYPKLHHTKVLYLVYLALNVQTQSFRFDPLQNIPQRTNSHSGIVSSEHLRVPLFYKCQCYRARDRTIYTHSAKLARKFSIDIFSIMGSVKY